MKIICVGRNYAAHIEELDNAVPEHPVLFLKPDTAILLKAITGRLNVSTRQDIHPTTCVLHYLSKRPSLPEIMSWAGPPLSLVHQMVI